MGVYTIVTEDDFDLKRIFECGQCFRWNMAEDGSFTGVAMGRAARVSCSGGTVTVTDSGSGEDGLELWRGYFDMDRDYRAARKILSVDDYMADACRYGAGIRILNQDRWETLCSFIISQCNNIPRIKKIVETMCRLFGKEVKLEGKKYFTFPSADTVAELTVEELAPLRSGYRAPYIIAAAKAVASGELDLEKIAKGDIANARKALKAMPGIGDKVANCVILFSLRMPGAFPIDVWVRRAIDEHYPEGFDPSVFGLNAGLAQQYMFYYQREEGKKKDSEQALVNCATQ